MFTVWLVGGGGELGESFLCFVAECYRLTQPRRPCSVSASPLPGAPRLPSREGSAVKAIEARDVDTLAAILSLNPRLRDPHESVCCLPCIDGQYHCDYPLGTPQCCCPFVVPGVSPNSFLRASNPTVINLPMVSTDRNPQSLPVMFLRQGARVGGWFRGRAPNTELCDVPPSRNAPPP